MNVSLALLWVIETTAAGGAFQLTLAFPGVPCLALGFFALLLFSRPMLNWCSIGSCKIFNLHFALIFAIASCLLYGNTLQPKRLRVDFIALGQGDCILVRTPNDQTILIDGGPPPSKLSTRQITQLEEVLLTEGIAHIDAVVLTHPQTDHIGVLPEVIRRFPVGVVMEGIADESSKAYQNFHSALSGQNVTPIQIQQGDSFELGGVQFWALNPMPNTNNPDVNEQSVVLWMHWKEFDALLTGDIGTKTEKKLTQQFEDWDADVLKVAHHGSRYSTSDNFLEETQPEFAIIQVGRNNYDHPHIDTRQRLYAINAHVLRNDYDGTIQLQTNGDGDYRLYATRSNRLYLFRE